MLRSSKVGHADAMTIFLSIIAAVRAKLEKSLAQEFHLWPETPTKHYPAALAYSGLGNSD
jgi:hypothetical protein